MKKSLIGFLFVFAAGIQATAEELNVSIVSVVVENPTLDGMPFLSYKESVAYVCQLKGYSVSEIVLEKEPGTDVPCWDARLLGNGMFSSSKTSSLFILNNTRCGDGNGKIITKARCSRPL